MKSKSYKKRLMNKDKVTKFKLAHGVSLWFTGLPSSGKTTIAEELSNYLDNFSVPNVILDGDEIRPIIAKGINFSKDGRLKSLDKYIRLCNVILRSKMVVILALNHHSEKQRRIARESYPLNRYIEIWVDTPLDVCMKRDVKGLYKKALKGKTKNLVGISIKFENPVNYNIKIHTLKESLQEAVYKVFQYLKKLKIIIPYS